MKATLEFNLDDLDDKMSHMRCVKSTDMALLLWEIRINLERNVRDKVNNSNPIVKDNDDTNAGIEIVLNELDRLFHEHDINIEELVH